MIEPVQVLWSSAGTTLPSLGARALVDVTDGDTPTFRMPIRMLSVDTPEVTARTDAGAAKVDEQFTNLAGWIRAGKAPITPGFAEYVLPMLDSGKSGTLQFTQGKAASAFNDSNIKARLARPGDKPRNLFIRITDTPFDNYQRLLAYVAPDYTEKERATMTRAQRSTFNLDLLTTGWAAPFVIYPSVPGELDLPLLIEAAATARENKLGIWHDDLTLLAYEYRAMEKLHDVTKKIVEGTKVGIAERLGWRDRYCADMRTRVVHGPEGYVDVPPEYRLWIWSADVGKAVGQLNLTPAPALVGAG